MGLRAQCKVLFAWFVPPKDGLKNGEGIGIRIAYYFWPVGLGYGLIKAGIRFDSERGKNG